MKHLLSLHLWYFFESADLTEVIRQNNKLFNDLFSKARVGNIDEVEKILKAIFTYESDENYPKDAWHIYAENQRMNLLWKEMKLF